jgi:hypothetical protein
MKEEHSEAGEQCPRPQWQVRSGNDDLDGYKSTTPAGRDEPEWRFCFGGGELKLNAGDAALFFADAGEGVT